MKSEPAEVSGVLTAPLLTPIVRPRSYEAILTQVEALLADGRLTVGDRLPPERALSEQLGVSRGSVREALKVLEALGLVRTTGGQGRESRIEVIARPQEAIGTALRLHAASAHLPVADLVETRIVLESATVTRLCLDEGLRGRLGSALSPAAQLLEQMAGPGLTPVEYLGLDARFHIALAHAGGNSVVAVVMESLRTAIEGYVRRGLAAVPDWPLEAARLQAEHAGVLDAVRAGRAEAATELIRAHIAGFYHRTLVG